MRVDFYISYLAQSEKVLVYVDGVYVGFIETDIEGGRAYPVETTGHFESLPPITEEEVWKNFRHWFQKITRSMV